MSIPSFELLYLWIIPEILSTTQRTVPIQFNKQSSVEGPLLHNKCTTRTNSRLLTSHAWLSNEAENWHTTKWQQRAKSVVHGFFSAYVGRYLCIEIPSEKSYCSSTTSTWKRVCLVLVGVFRSAFIDRAASERAPPLPTFPRVPWNGLGPPARNKRSVF